MDSFQWCFQCYRWENVNYSTTVLSLSSSSCLWQPLGFGKCSTVGLNFLNSCLMCGIFPALFTPRMTHRDTHFFGLLFWDLLWHPLLWGIPWWKLRCKEQWYSVCQYLSVGDVQIKGYLRLPKMRSASFGEKQRIRPLFLLCKRPLAVCKCVGKGLVFR